MKRLILIGLLLSGIGAASYAQVDDIYATGNDQRGKTDSNANKYAYNDQPQDDGDYQSYIDGDDYIDYDDDYSYATRINRFDYGFYNMGYYSAFYNPYWYDPYWYGYGYGGGWGMGWGRPYYGMSFGYGYGPYWSSAWGWNTWYGYSGFNSCYNYPYYAGGWYGNCYGGYWNSYYAGVDRRYYTNSRAVSYGPRQNMGNRVGYRLASTGVRQTNTYNQIGLRTAPGNTGRQNNRGVYNGGRNNVTAERGNTYDNRSRGYNENRRIAERGNTYDNRSRGYSDPGGRTWNRENRVRNFMRGGDRSQNYANPGNNGEARNYSRGSRDFGRARGNDNSYGPARSNGSSPRGGGEYRARDNGGNRGNWGGGDRSGGGGRSWGGGDQSGGRSWGGGGHSGGGGDRSGGGGGGGSRGGGRR